MHGNGVIEKLSDPNVGWDGNGINLGRYHVEKLANGVVAVTVYLRCASMEQGQELAEEIVAKLGPEEADILLCTKHLARAVTLMRSGALQKLARQQPAITRKAKP